MDQNLHVDDVPTAAELASAVTAQHGVIKMTFHEAKHGPASGRQAATRRLLLLLAMHEAAEQLTVHPALARAGGGQTGIGDDRMSEEEQAVQLAERLQELEPGSYEHSMQLALLEEAVLLHATTEEKTELPLFGELEDGDRRRLSRALTAVADAVEGACPIEYDAFSRMVSDSRAWLGG